MLSISCSGTKVKVKAHPGAVMRGPIPYAFSEQGGSFSNSAPNFVYMGGEMEQGVSGGWGWDLGGWNQSGASWGIGCNSLCSLSGIREGYCHNLCQWEAEGQGSASLFSK